MPTSSAIVSPPKTSTSLSHCDFRAYSNDFGFRQIVNVTGTAYLGDDDFPDVVFRYGLKQAIADKVVKKPNYKIEETYTAHDWQKTYAIHQQNRKDYGAELNPISI